MAKKELVENIVKLYSKLGGNMNDVLGSRSNITFLGTGKNPEPFTEMSINIEAVGALGKSKVLDELKSPMGYLTADKLNDIQASKLYENLLKLDEFYNPRSAPANITDMATGTRDLDPKGLAALRSRIDDLPPGDPDLPPPGSRGGPDDIAAPFSGAGLEAIKDVKGVNLIVDDIVNKIYSNAGVSANAQPVVRANAREFLNRVKDLEDPEFRGGTTLAGIMEPSDFKFMTEGGGGIFGDPLLIVQKYFGPKVASSVAQLDNADDIQKFAENLVKIKDARGNSITSRYFDPESINPDDFSFEDGGRVGYFGGARVLGKMGYQALRKYGIEADDITRLFKDLAVDKSLVGKEKTMYFHRLNQVLKNPDDFPDGIKEIQLRLGLDPIGFKSGGLAGILEV